MSLVDENAVVRRQDPTKPSFFDLPAELRIAVYEYFCAFLFEGVTEHSWDSYKKPENKSEDVVRCLSDPYWEWYWQSITDFQLTSRQLQEDFVPYWASRTIFAYIPDTPGYSLYNYEHASAALDQAFSREIHGFFNHLGPLTRQHVRKVTFRTCFLEPKCCGGSRHHRDTCKLTDARELLKLIPRVGRNVNLQLEEMRDVHPDLVVEIVMEMHNNVSHNDIQHVREVVRLKQKSIGLAHGVGITRWVRLDVFTMKRFASRDGLTWAGPAEWHDC